MTMHAVAPVLGRIQNTGTSANIQVVTSADGTSSPPPLGQHGTEPGTATPASFSRDHGIPSRASPPGVLLTARARFPAQVGVVIRVRMFLVNASLGPHPKLLEDR